LRLASLVVALRDKLEPVATRNQCGHVPDTSRSEPLAVGREWRDLAEVLVVHDVAVAGPHDLGRMLALETLLHLLVTPILTGEPGQHDRHGSRGARRGFGRA